MDTPYINTVPEYDLSIGAIRPRIWARVLRAQLDNNCRVAKGREPIDDLIDARVRMTQQRVPNASIEIMQRNAFVKQPKYKQYQVQRAKRERKRQELSIMQWWWFKEREPIARYTMYLGFLTLGLVVVGAFQFCSMRGQLAEMKSGGVDTHNLALAAKLDQRSWVGYGLMTLETPKVGEVAHATVTYFNTGRTPARNAAPLTRFKFLPTMVSSEAELVKLSEDGGSPTTILGVMYPGMAYSVPVEGRDKFNEAALKAMPDWYAYIWGEINYLDVFGDPHTMEFCGYRKGLIGGFLQCPFHNQPDTQIKPN